VFFTLTRPIGSTARRQLFRLARSNRDSRTVCVAAYWRCGERSLHDRWRHSYSRHAFTPRGVAHLGMGDLDERLRLNGLHRGRQRDRHGNFDGGVDVAALSVGDRVRWEITARVSPSSRGLNATPQLPLRRLFFVPLLTLTFPNLQTVSALRGESCAGSHLLFLRSCRTTKRFRVSNTKCICSSRSEFPPEEVNRHTGQHDQNSTSRRGRCKPGEIEN
jgi:hypothetical protein